MTVLQAFSLGVRYAGFLLLIGAFLFCLWLMLVAIMATPDREDLGNLYTPNQNL